jgi:sugar lactone lactonase YvrE
MRRIYLAAVASLVLFCGFLSPASGAAEGQAKYRPSLYMELPEYCNTPDAMAVDGQGNLIVSVPNFNDPTYPGILLKITPDRTRRIAFPMPVHPDTKRSGPMGVDMGPDGNLYVADAQYFYARHASRLIRVNRENGRMVGSEVVAKGFNLANAVKWKGNEVYVTETFLDTPKKKGMGAVYRLSMEELNDGPVEIKPGGKDPHVLATFQAKGGKGKNPASADGMCFDADGNLYTGLFGTGAFFRLTFDEKGNVDSKECLLRTDRLPCVDGIFYDDKVGMIYITDSAQNAVHAYDVSADTLETLWENEDTDGSGGLLDQPCEPRVWNGKLIVVNFDMPMPGMRNTTHDRPHTISAIDLDH